MDRENIQQKCIKWFYSYLPIYDEELRKIINRQKYEKTCGYRQLSPIPTRMYIIWIISYLHNNRIDTKKMENDFHVLDKGLIDYREKFRDIYYKNVYCDFRLLVDNYNPDSILVDDFLFESVINNRTYIEQFSAELKGVYDISNDMARVRELDEILRDKIKESVKEKTYYPKDKFFAPEEYWWLHLEDKYGKPEEIID